MAKHHKKHLRKSVPKDAPRMECEQESIADWLKKVRFKKKLFGGVSEYDVWRKIDELNNMYNAALIAERVRYDTLLEQKKADAETKPWEGGA